MISSFFFLGNPARSQNVRLIVFHKDGKNLLPKINSVVSKYNSKIPDSDKGKFGKKCSGVIVKEKNAKGHYKVVWTSFKNNKTSGPITTYIQHPHAIRAFDLYFGITMIENETPLLVNEYNESTHQSSTIFVNASERIFGQRITIQDLRTVLSNAAKDSNDPLVYEMMCEMQLHTKQVADFHYLKPDSFQQIEKRREVLSKIGDERLNVISDSKVLVENFMLTGNYELKFEKLKKFVENFKEEDEEDDNAPIDPMDIDDEEETIVIPDSPIPQVPTPSTSKSPFAKFIAADGKFHCDECPMSTNKAFNLKRHMIDKHSRSEF